MKEIKAKALFKIKKGKLEEFKQLIPQFISAVKEKDPGTITYEWYLVEEKMECVVLEIYADSNAMLAHIANAGELLQQSLEFSEPSLEVFGNPSEELLKVFEGFGARIYPYYSGI